MLNRTHLAITIFFILLFFPLVENKLAFSLIAIFSSMIPDVDISTSKIGKYKIFRPLQFFIKHRGFFHCLLFMILFLLFFLNFYPAGAFAFFIGYSSHLISDSFTPEGVQFFYPSKKVISGNIKTGGKLEKLVFLLFIFLNILLIFVRFFKI